MNNNRAVGQPIPLVSKRPMSEDEKFEKTIEMLLERSNDKILGEMRAMNRNLERSVNRLLENIEGVVRGEREVAIASVVDGDADDLPRIPRLKAEPTMLYKLKTGAIAKEVGLSTGRVSFLLNKSGLDWVTRKPELWSDGLYSISNTRLWHLKTVDLLKEVLANPAHPDRKNATASCRKVLKSLDRERES